LKTSILNGYNNRTEYEGPPSFMISTKAIQCPFFMLPLLMFMCMKLS